MAQNRRRQVQKKNKDANNSGRKIGTCKYIANRTIGLVTLQCKKRMIYAPKKGLGRVTHILFCPPNGSLVVLHMPPNKPGLGVHFSVSQAKL